ncbi:hypothetical protein GND98_012720 [Clostridium butyricum]|uniref:Uncharacterized protein n=1 Tax=Clostridium butyricum TaxID=1492 RepID=A0A6L9EQ84_CLOBU|nr:hypothetical protein [Clostridium butyricum]
MKKDILYSLAINYIYDKWSNKDKKNEIVYIKPEELFDYINTAIVNENFAYNYIIKIIMEIEGEIEEEIRDEFIDEGKESQIDDIITKEYKDKFIECLDFFKSTLNNKLNRFKLINTLSLVEVKTYDKYDLLSTTEEIQELAQIKELLFVYIKRLLKFNKYYNIELEKCLDFNNDIILFNIPDEMRSCVLFSNSKRSTRTSHKNLLKRLYKAKLKPKVWYFDKIDLPNRLYNSSIMKPSLNKEVVITNPEKNDYFIECMDCLQEDSYTKCDKIFCIFKEECISNGERKDN